MFTGIVECVGMVEGIRSLDGGKSMDITAPGIASELAVGDSIAVDGVCLTVTRQTRATFSVDCLTETLRKTMIGGLEAGVKVNLERAMSAMNRFDGHLVQGHVNGRGTIERITRKGESRYLHIRLPANLLLHCVPEGSVTVQGISLTIAAVNPRGVAINIIPHTWETTTLSGTRAGMQVNIETDIIGRYVERLMRPGYPESAAGHSSRSEAGLRNWLAGGIHD